MARSKRNAADQGAATVRELPMDAGILESDQVRECLGDPDALYYRDAGSWALVQAALMRNGEYDRVDWDNVIEEVEHLAGKHRDAWQSNCSNVGGHMLKILHTRTEGEHHKNLVDGWVKEIVRKDGFRRRMLRRVDVHPGMKNRFEEMVAGAWRWACRDAGADLSDYEGGSDPEDWARKLLEEFPQECPWTLVELAGYNPRDRNDKARPGLNVWPAEVAQHLNRVLGTNYPECGWDTETEKGPAMTVDEIEQREREGLGRGRWRGSMAELGREA